MRIVVIAGYPQIPSMPHGGVEAAVTGLVKNLTKSRPGWRVDVVDIRGTGTEFRSESFSVVRLGRTGWRRRLTLLDLGRYLRAIRACRPDLCNLHGTGWAYLLLCLVLRGTGIPVCLNVHGILRKEAWTRLKRRPSLKHLLQFAIHSVSEELMLHLANGVVVDTPYVAQALGLRKGRRLAIIPQGAFHEFESGSERPIANLLMTVAVFSRRKGHEFAIRAVKQLIGRFPDLRYKIVGVATEEAYLAEIEALIVELGLSDHVELMKNAPPEQVRPLLPRARAFLLHSEEESQGLALCEAMLAGVPVVATDVAAIPFVVPHDRAGLLSPHGDVNAFAEHVASLLGDDALHDRLAAGASAWAMQFRWSKVADRMATYFAELAKAK